MNHPTGFSQGRKPFAVPSVESFSSFVRSALLSSEGVPPDSNTGGKSSQTSQNSGFSIEVSQDLDEYPVHIDALTFTIMGSYFCDLKEEASRFLRTWTDSLFMIGDELGKRYNGYAHCYQVIPIDGSESPSLGWVGVSSESDNMRGRWCFCLTGEACSMILDWKELYEDLSEMDGRITRVDVALDDLLGRHPLKECEAAYDDGLFVTRGAPPKARTIRHKQSQEGDTLYVGSRASGKLFRCYEKGKQLGDPKSSWVRYEGELHHTNYRCIPLDILINPLPYLKGMYSRAFSWMSGNAQMIAVLKDKALISVQVATEWLRRQGGFLVSYLRECLKLSDDQIVGLIKGKPGRYPKRLDFTTMLDKKALCVT